MWRNYRQKNQIRKEKKSVIMLNSKNIALNVFWCSDSGSIIRLTARIFLYASSHRQDTTYHGHWYTSHGALAGTRNCSIGSTMEDRSDDPSHDEWTLLPLSYISLPHMWSYVTVSITLWSSTCCLMVSRSEPMGSWLAIQPSISDSHFSSSSSCCCWRSIKICWSLEQTQNNRHKEQIKY